MSNYTSKHSGVEIDAAVEKLQGPLSIAGGGGTGSETAEGALLNLGVKSELNNYMKLTPSNAPSDLLHIELNGNYDSVNMQTSYVGTEDASTIINSPLSSGAFYAIRQVYRIPNQYGGYHFLVHLLEAYPSQGRMWFRMYDINSKVWRPAGGWNCISPVSGW